MKRKWISVLLMIVMTASMPVSYTHLDVYKRQGVSFMENQASWHCSAPNDEQYAVAMADLEKVGEALCQK